MKKIFTLIAIFASLSLSAQKLVTNNINLDQPAFAAGEELRYTASYRSFLINTNIAEVVIKVSDDIKNDKPAYSIYANARVFPFYKWFFDMNDSYHSWLEKETLRPIQCRTEINEDSYKFRSTFTYDWDNMTVTTDSKNLKRKTEKTKTYPIKSFYYDGFSLFFNLRSTKAIESVPGWYQVLNVVLEDTVKHLRFTYLGKENKNVKGIGTFRTLKYSCQLTTSANEAFPDGSEFHIWLTDDKNMVPVYVETPLRVGKARVMLTSFRGLKYPLESLIAKKR